MATSRQLAAILFADIQGYTAIMQHDEANAMVIRDKFQKTLEKEIKLRGGRIAVFSGDGALCVFKSAIEAVRAAMALQERMIEDPPVLLRIGIHTGDVITEGKNVYGDGVNIASRIESFAVAGSVFISGKVADEIKNQPGITAISLGKFELKNVREPIEIFAIKNDNLIVPEKEKLTGKGDRAAKKKVSLKKPLVALAILLLLVVSFFAYKKYTSAAGSSGSSVSQVSPIKTIAVLPFANLSGQKDDEYFADGICDEILTHLSKISTLTVLSRTSTLQFRDTKKTMKEIGEQIGAEALVEGSVQKSNGKIRITVQLIDAVHDKHLWAETYDRELKDVFSIQTDIAQQIAEALNTTLTEKEQEFFSKRPTDNMKAFDLYLRGNKYSDGFWHSSKMDQVPDAIKMYEEAIREDPKFLEAYTALIWLYTEISWRKPVTNYEYYRLKAKDWLDKMVALKTDNPIVHNAVALYKYEGERDYAGALEELKLVDKYFGNDKQTFDLRAYVLRRMGRLDEAQGLFLRLTRTYPKESYAYLELSSTYSLLRNADSAIYCYDRAIALHPDNVDFYIGKAGIYTDLKGDISRAKEIIKNATPFVDTAGLVLFQIYLDMLERNYTGAINRLLVRNDSLFSLSQSNMMTTAQMVAVLYNNLGNNQESKLYFRKSLDLLSSLVRLHPEDFRIHSALGIAYAGLGEKEKAVAAGIKARDMMPLSADAVIGIAPLENLALIYTLLGEQDKAIDMIGQLLKMPFGWDGSNSIPLYRTHPYWKPLQTNPRFQKMIQ